MPVNGGLSPSAVLTEAGTAVPAPFLWIGFLWRRGSRCAAADSPHAARLIRWVVQVRLEVARAWILAYRHRRNCSVKLYVELGAVGAAVGCDSVSSRSLFNMRNVSFNFEFGREL